MRFPLDNATEAVGKKLDLRSLIYLYTQAEHQLVVGAEPSLDFFVPKMMYILVSDE